MKSAEESWGDYAQEFTELIAFVFDMGSFGSSVGRGEVDEIDEIGEEFIPAR